MEVIIKILTVMLWSGFKFVVGIATAMALGFTNFETFFLSIGGGMIGVVVYLYLWETIIKLIRKFFPKKPKPVKFSPLKRKLVVFIKRYEVYGIALLTPVLFSMPIGTILASAIEPNKWRIKIIMLGALCFWALIIIGLRGLVKF
jgi:hypothetical protein